MPGVVVETGAGIAGANSYVQSTDVDTYFADRNDTIWTALGTSQKTAAIIKAGDYLKSEERFEWRGTRNTYSQTMPWPRSGAAILHGPSIPSSVIPQQLKDAQCELAWRAAQADVQPDLERGGMVKSERIDVLTTMWDDKAPPETVFPAVMGLLRSLLRNPLAPISAPFQATPTTTTPFSSANDFAFPGAGSTPLQSG